MKNNLKQNTMEEDDNQLKIPSTSTQKPVIVKDHQYNVNTIVEVIEKCALNPQVDVNKMEKLLDMQERILNRNARQAFASAMSLMQGDLPEITQKGEIKIRGEVQSKYGKFEDINEAIKPILKKFGFAISFRIKQEDKQIKVTAILCHSEGHSEETELILPVDTSGNKNSVQAVGSSVSYGKRYTMCALLNITTRGEDDDGKSAIKMIDNNQINRIKELIEKTNTDESMFLTAFEIDSINHMPVSSLNRALSMLRLKLQRMEASHGNS